MGFLDGIFHEINYLVWECLGYPYDYGKAMKYTYTDHIMSSHIVYVGTENVYRDVFAILKQQRTHLVILVMV